MREMSDLELVREYHASGSESAFAELVSRRVGLVFSAALRQVRDPHLAEEVTQAVFILLAQKAGRVSEGTNVAGWLFKTTRFVALAQARMAAKRHQQEQAIQMQSAIQPMTMDESWQQISPLLDEALARLGEPEREAVLLRFFEDKSLSEVGGALGVTEDAARKRISRSLEKLRRFFVKRGVGSTTATIAAVLSANAVHAAPPSLAKTACAAAVLKGAAAKPSTLTLIKTSLKLMAWAKAKTVVLTSVAVSLLATTATLTIFHVTEAQEKRSDSANEWGRSALTNAGCATPENAMKSLLWAISTGNSNTIVSRFSPDHQALAQRTWKEIFQPGLAKLRGQIAQTQSFQILSSNRMSDDVIVLDMYSKGRKRSREYSFQKIGDDWKCNRIFTEKAFGPGAERQSATTTP